MIQFEEVEVTVDDLTTGVRGQKKTLLSAINLELTQSRVALIGANGSGKSTLLKLINGLILPTRGQVLVDGSSTATAGRNVRRRVGYVFTDPLAQLVMTTPLDDVELSLRSSVRNRHDRRDLALKLLAERGLDGLANQSIYDLSGGERQLVSLTTVLAVQPSVIVADEPTTLLDLKNRQLLRRAFDELDQQLIVSTHDLELASDAERVLLMDEGRVAADGPAREVISYYRTAMMS